ncbi:MAG: hypothetical protein DRJ61_15780 [Acidobacteria bacterium]|nr:MAG: hypothetical protein DRJ61_15780 [Acidobacteriota bacterium]
MANDYYTRVKTFSTGTKAKGTDVASELDLIVTGLDLFPSSARVNSGNTNYVAAGGTADALTITNPGTTWTTYTGKDGHVFNLQIAANNTGAVTIAVDGLSTVTVARGDGASLQAADLIAGAFIDICYNESVGDFLVKQSVASIVADQVVGAPAASETGIVKVTSAAFEGTVSDGDAVYWDSGNTRYAKAVADGTAAQRAVGFADVTNAKVELSGVMSSLTSGLTAGATYYLSTTAGAISTTMSSVFMGEARTTSALLININHGEPKLKLATHFLVG